MTGAPYATIFEPKAGSAGRAKDMTIFIEPVSYVCRIGAENKVSHEVVSCKTLRAKYLEIVFDVILSVHFLFSTMLYQRPIYLSVVICLLFSTYFINQLSIPSHSAIFPGGYSDQPSSSSVQFDFALLRSIDVDTRLASSFAPPLAMGII